VQAWTCPVLFSDNAAGFAVAKELTERHAALSAQRDSLQERLSTTGRSAQVRNSQCDGYGRATATLEACNFFMTAMSIPANSMGLSLLFPWGPQAHRYFTSWCPRLVMPDACATMNTHRSLPSSLLDRVQCRGCSDSGSRKGAEG
jgi:hypothetical protein